MSKATEAFTAWFAATNPGKEFIAQALSVIDDAPPFVAAAIYLDEGFTAEPGWPSLDAAQAADRLTDAEYKLRARGDDGSTYTPGDYRVQFLARLIEAEWKAMAPLPDAPAPPVAVKPDMARALMLVGELAVELRRIGGL